MTIHSGIDLVYIPRFEILLDDPKFVERVFSGRELEDQRLEHLAGLFAAKEAFFKATGVKISKWNELEVLKSDNGKPYFEFDSRLVAYEITSIDVSISHDHEYAVANVVILEALALG